MKKSIKEQLIDKYEELTYKLGKFPSRREAHRLGLTKDTIDYHFDKHSEFVKAVLDKYPSLERFQTAPKLQSEDVLTHRLGIEGKITKKKNGKLVADFSTLDYIASFAENVFKGKVKPSNNKTLTKPIKRIHTLVLSDLHIGADISSEETGSLEFGIKEESRRLATIIRAAAKYKPQYRKHTKLKLALLGDIIENNMHDARTGATIAEQTCRAIHILIQAIAYLANEYGAIEVECATGNHDRNPHRHAQRAIHEKWDSIATIIYYALKSSCSALKNVSFNIPKTPLASYEVFGKRIGYTHGDTVLNTGNPGSAVNVKSLTEQVNKLNSALPDKDEYSAILYGHTHTGHAVFLNNGAVLLGNGALPPPDSFAVSIGIMESHNNGQWMFESTEKYPVGDLRFLRVGTDYENDDSLDKVIKPWKSFNS